MVVYEVNLKVHSDAAGEFALWLDGHIREILKLEGFVSAEWLDAEAEHTEGEVHWTVQYRLKDRESLENYFERHAEAMRREGVERFPGKMTATRRVLQVRSTYPSSE